jgi:TRAP-type mannitol/chloroaromatic compound transport system permease large subunit
MKTQFQRVRAGVAVQLVMLSMLVHAVAGCVARSLLQAVC